MKCLIFSHFYEPSVGGVETFVRTLMAGFRSDPGNIQATLITRTPKEPGTADNLRILRRPSMFQTISEILRADVILLAGPLLTPMLLAVVTRKPFIVEHHAYQAICPNGMLLDKSRGRLCAQAFQNRNLSACLSCLKHDNSSADALLRIVVTFLRNFLCRHATANIAITNHVKLRHALPRTHVIYYGVDPVAPPAPVPDSSGTVRFAYLGRLVEEKGLDLLIDAIAVLAPSFPSLSLLLIGDGPQRRHLEKKIEGCGLSQRVSITGLLTGRALAETMQSVQVVVMPSIWEETAGLSAIEHMMRGRPVVAADIGGLGEVVGSAGSRFRPNDLDDLVNQISALASSAPLRDALGESARVRALQLFQTARMVDEHRALLRSVAAAG